MSQSINLLTETVNAGGVISACRAVTASGGYPTAAAHCMGITEIGADASGDAMPVVTMGTAVAEVGEAVNLDDALEVGADGVLMVQSAGVTVARARQAATAAGQKITVFLLPS